MPAPEAAETHHAAHVPEEDDEEEYGAPAAALSPAARRRELDQSVLSVLREEAEREQHARRAEGLEVQPDLGLSEPAAADLARQRIDRLRAAGAEANQRPAGDGPDRHPAPEDAGHAPATAPEPQTPPEPAASPQGSRRDLFPDIEEINSTLRPSSERGRNDPAAGQGAEAPAERRRGFRLGFGFALIVVALMMVAYTSAPKIKGRLPEAAPLVDGYVHAVDNGRAWVNRALVSAVKAINRETGGDSQ